MSFPSKEKLPVDFIDWAGIFFMALCLKQFFALLTIFLVEKITWHESPTFADSNEVILIVFKQLLSLQFVKYDWCTSVHVSKGIDFYSIMSKKYTTLIKYHEI